MATNGQNGDPEHWRALYRAALHEASSDKLPQRIRMQRKQLWMKYNVQADFKCITNPS